MKVSDFDESHFICQVPFIGNRDLIQGSPLILNPCPSSLFLYASRLTSAFTLWVKDRLTRGAEAMWGQVLLRSWEEKGSGHGLREKSLRPTSPCNGPSLEVTLVT